MCFSNISIIINYVVRALVKSSSKLKSRRETANLYKPKKEIMYMPIKTVTIKVPADIPEKKIKLLVAAELYSEGSITLKQAADLAELPVWDLIHELGKMKVSFTNISVEDLREEVEGFD
jgi:predicted HTH domain antitoxin